MTVCLITVLFQLLFDLFEVKNCAHIVISISSDMAIQARKRRHSESSDSETGTNLRSLSSANSNSKTGSGSDEEEEFDIAGDIALNASDSEESGSESSDSSPEEYSEHTQYADIIEYSDEEEEETNSDKKSKNKKTETLTFPSLELSDTEENAGSKSRSNQKLGDSVKGNDNGDDDDDDEVNEYFTSNNVSTTKFKKGSFASFGLSKLVLANITRKGFRQPTPIQRKTIPLILQGRDIVGMARTGSGKTAAFLLPMIEKLKTHSTKIGARAVILSPSRELAIQTHTVLKEFSRGTQLRSVLLTGGDSLEDQFGMMMNNPDIIVATPGRFLHLKVEMSLDLKSVEYAVFDEADRLFEMGFQDQLNELLASLPANRQTLLFSATLPSSLVGFAKAGLTNPVLVRLDTETKISENLEMLFLSTKNDEREATLLYILQNVIKLPLATEEERQKLQKRNSPDYDEDDDDDDGDSDSDKTKKRQKVSKRRRSKFYQKLPSANELPSEKATVIFVPTRHHVEYITQLLEACGYLVSHIYGTLDQHARRLQLYNFRLGLTSIMVVTDVAARGVDIPLLANVINYSLPASSKIFVHRVGRTARAGNRGWAYTIVSENELPYLLDLELFLGRKVLLTPMYEATCDLMRRRWVDEGKDESLFEPPKVSYTNRIVLGSCPRFELENSSDLYVTLLNSKYDIQTARNTALKAEKLYFRTRTSASPESVKRSKEIISEGWDEQNIIFGKNPEKAKMEFLSKLQNRTNKETVFEFARNADDEMAIFMKKRRKQIEPIQRRAQERKELLERERLAGLSHSIEDSVLHGDKTEAGYSVPEAVLEQFEDADKVLENQILANRKHDDQPRSFRDPNFFLSHYAPANDIQDKQLNLTSGFLNDAAQASYDLNDDDKVQVHKQTPTVKWDKKRKKYVNMQGIDNKKYIIGEGGQKIAASFKSGKFTEWAKARKLRPLKVGARESSVPTRLLADPSHNDAGNDNGTNQQIRKFKHKQMKAPKLPDKHRDDYEKQKKKVEKAVERGAHVKGYNGPGMRNELKSTAQIRKARILKEKRRAKNARPSRKSRH